MATADNAWGHAHVQRDRWERGDSSGSWWDETFNPWWGCTKVSPACTNCYAEAVDASKGPYFARRSGQVPSTHWGHQLPRLFQSDAYWRKPVEWDAKAKRAGIQLRVFCGSMCDVFEDRDELIPHRERLWALMPHTPNLIWQVLTKRPENFLRFLPQGAGLLSNLCLGVTAENQATADRRIPLLLAVPASIRFVSYEPALGAVDFLPFLMPIGGARIDWLIAGDEDTRRDRARATDVQWIRSVRDQCAATNVAFHFKQWAGRTTAGIDGERDRRGKIHLPLLDGTRWAELPHTSSQARGSSLAKRTNRLPQFIHPHHEAKELIMDPHSDPDDEGNAANNELPDGYELSADVQLHDPERERAIALINQLKTWSAHTDMANQIVAVLTHHVDKGNVWRTAGYASLDAYLRDVFGFTSADPIYAKRLAAGSKIWKFMPKEAWDWVRRFEENAQVPDAAEARFVYAEAERKRLEQRKQPRKVNPSQARTRSTDSANDAEHSVASSPSAQLVPIDVGNALGHVPAPPVPATASSHFASVPLPPAPVTISPLPPMMVALTASPAPPPPQPISHAANLEDLFHLLSATEFALTEQMRNAALTAESKAKIGNALRRLNEIANRAGFQPGPPTAWAHESSQGSGPAVTYRGPTPPPPPSGGSGKYQPPQYDPTPVPPRRKGLNVAEREQLRAWGGSRIHLDPELDYATFHDEKNGRRRYCVPVQRIPVDGARQEFTPSKLVFEIDDEKKIIAGSMEVL